MIGQDWKAYMTTKTADSRGRITLGQEYANRLVLVEEMGGGVLRIVPAQAVPAPEAWLYENPEALKSVLRGLEQAKARQTAQAPDLDADGDLAHSLAEE
jgi:hypothetical protein